MVTDETVSFSVEKEKNARTKEILKQVYEALSEKGYNPINQIVGIYSLWRSNIYNKS